MNNILQVTPFMQVDDFAAGVAFWRDLLGFKVLVQSDVFAYVEREGTGVRILDCGPDYRGQQPTWRPYRYYFDVRDLDAIYGELKPRLDALPEGEVYGPVDQAHGQRELMILAPDGAIVIFGQAIGPVQST